MSFLTYFQSLKEPEHRLAWAVAIAADALQIAAFPLFVEGGIPPPTRCSIWLSRSS